jgi:bacillithiol biosynthesis cysteine-adding enzyme BshC
VGAVRSEFQNDWYAALGPALSASGAAAERIARVASGGGVVVTTGQQAGLFGGPLYTIAKAFSAIELAAAIERELGVPAAAVFWAATDDADFLEASVAYVADARGLHELRLTEKPAAGTPMSLARLGPMDALLQQLRAACGSAAYAEFYDLVATAFASEATVGDAYVRMMRALLEPLGMAVLDSSHAAYRAAARPVLLEALRRAPEIAQADAECEAAIRAAGFEPQVRDDRGLSLVATIDHGSKTRVPVDHARRIAESKSAHDLAPNVLLRPVVERAILPTVAYVAGPAELAYFAQSAAVAATIGRPAPVGVPRWSGTVIEPFVERALGRLEVPYHELRDVTTLERRLAVAALPPEVARAWDALTRDMDAAVAHLAGAVDHTALMPPPVIEGLRRSLEHRLKRTERRLLAAVKRKEERIRVDLHVAAAALFPLGARQERVLNYTPMLARGGDELVKDLRAAARQHAVSLVRAAHSEPVAAR